MAVNRLLVLLLAAVTTVNAQCYALCLVSECEHATKHVIPAGTQELRFDDTSVTIYRR